jgi:tight adherence protein B
MGAILGLVAALGVLLLAQWWSDRGAAPAPATRAPARPGPVRQALDGAGLDDVGTARVVATCVGAGIAGAFGMLVVSGTPAVALAFGALAAWTPIGVLGRRASARREALAASWPDAVDDLASAVRAGLSLPESVAALADRGPEALRPAFARFAAEFRVSGAFDACLDALKAELADPVGDRVVEALRLARDVGGTDLGRLLRTLSAVLREDARTRAELVARQSWAVNAARIAVLAPWATLAFLSLRPGALAAYDSAGGVVVLLIAVVLSSVAYAAMRRIGRLPVNQRVLA